MLTSISDGQLTNVLLTVIGSLMALIWRCTRDWMQKVDKRIDELVQREATCATRFADAKANFEAHTRMDSRLDNHEVRINELENKSGYTRPGGGGNL